MDLSELLRSDTPLIDVRAPVEFSDGAFPTAVNLPILDDDERRQVGIAYKASGPGKAEALGYELVSGEVRETRIAGWLEFIHRHPDAHLYCFRGGSRSKIACEWIKAAGPVVPRVEGGYKAMRRHLLSVLDRERPMLTVAGKTGVGKTDFILQFDNHVDLEGIARHRGSAFGATVAGQPSQVDFENGVAIALIKLGTVPGVIIEDESRLIGRIHVPLPIQAAIKRAPVILLEETLEARVNRIQQDYIADGWRDHRATFGHAAHERFCEYLLGALDRIRKRLGGESHQALRAIMEDALAATMNDDLSRHPAWIENLLTDYYDPMYEYQLKDKMDRVVARGTHTEMAEWIAREETPYG